MDVISINCVGIVSILSYSLLDIVMNRFIAQILDWSEILQICSVKLYGTSTLA